MEPCQLFMENAKLLGLQVDALDSNTESVSIQLEGYPDITLEKIPERDYLALTGVLCRYPEREKLNQIFEILLNAHSYGIYTNDAFFAANSGLEQIILHKIMPIDGTDSAILKQEILIFAIILKSWREAYDQGNLPPQINISDETSLRESEMALRV